MTILERVEVTPIAEYMVENRLRLFEHVERFVDFVLRRVDQMEDTQITRDSGSPKKLLRKI